MCSKNTHDISIYTDMSMIYTNFFSVGGIITNLHHNIPQLYSQTSLDCSLPLDTSTQPHILRKEGRISYKICENIIIFLFGYLVPIL